MAALSEEAGIIPALAGNTAGVCQLSTGTWDHPRSRGEYTPFPESKPLWQGSSPLSRGILLLLSQQNAQARIIPALAGNTPSMRKARVGSRDHPRSRGEYNVTKSKLLVNVGSSPLSRGIPRLLL